jgi:hypothetical protein
MMDKVRCSRATTVRNPWSRLRPQNRRSFLDRAQATESYAQKLVTAVIRRRFEVA